MLKKIVIFLCILFLSPLSLTQDEITNILLIGTDDLLEQVTTEKKMGRADAIYLVSINSSKATIKLLGIERDYLVDLGEHGGKNKLATSTYFGGIDSCILQVNSLLDLDIKNYVQVDIPGVMSIIDSLGGLTVELSQEEIDQIKQTMLLLGFKKDLNHLKPGENHLDVSLSHVYLRLRDDNKDYISSNADRNSRHKKAISSLLKTAASLPFDQVLDILNQSLKHISSNLTFAEITELIEQVQGINPDSFSYLRSPSTDFKRKREGFHQVVVCNDLTSEQRAVKDFLFK